jgi:hypothetical protein
MAGGATSIGGGLSLAVGQLAVSTLQRQNVVVVSDGKENTPPMLAEIPIPDGTRVFTVGVGLTALLDVDKLEALATENGGYFQVTDGNDEQLAKFFTQIASDVFGQQIAVDPVLTMRHGQPQDVPVHLCDGDQSATVVLTWDDPNAVFDFAWVSPSGMVLGPTALTWIKQAPRHLIGKLQLRGSRWHRPGVWKVRVMPLQVPRATEVAVVSVVVVSDIHVSWTLTGLHERAIKSRHTEGTSAHAGFSMFPSEAELPVGPAALHRGDSLLIDIGLTSLNHSARLISGEAIVRTPKVSLSELARHFANIDLDKLSERDLRREHDMLVKQLASRTKGRPTARRRTYRSKGAHDGASVGFRLAMSGPDGIYEVLLRVVGVTATGEPFQRERTVQVVVRQ